MTDREAGGTRGPGAKPPPVQGETVRVGVHGALGRMGRASCRWIEEADGLELVARCDQGDDLAAALLGAGAQVCIDFTTAAVRMQAAETILGAGVRPVLGTSGFLPEDVSKLDAQCRERGLGGLVVPNFSLGAVLMIELAARAARHLTSVAIVEAHHERKTDAPSGTALAAAARLREVLGGRDVPVSSVRVAGFHSRHEVILGGRDERLVLTHEAISPEAFRDGVLLAVRHAPRLDGIVFGLGPLLFGAGAP